jgi:hypothetical protein
MIPSGGTVTPAARWKEIIRRASRTTLRTSPLVWALAMIPLVFEGSWNLRTVGLLTWLALAMLPVIFLLVVALQLLPRSWYSLNR